MHDLDFPIGLQECHRRSSIVPIGVKLREDLLLVDDNPTARSNVCFGLPQMPLEHCTVHEATT